MCLAIQSDALIIIIIMITVTCTQAKLEMRKQTSHQGRRVQEGWHAAHRANGKFRVWPS